MTVATRIETLNCRFVDVLNIQLDDIYITDIAHALAHQCRFNGYTSRHYSVAEHSVYVSRLVERMAIEAGWTNKEAIREAALQALLHDATEAYLIDVPRPVKGALTEYKAIEDRLWAVLAERFRVPSTMHPFIKVVDMRMCVTEKLALMSASGLDRPEWSELNAGYPAYEGDWDIIDRYELAPGIVRRRFLDRFDHLKGTRHA